MYKNINYFKGLNGLRFFAAFLVLLHHAEQIRMKYGMCNFKEYSIFNNGGIAVGFFFVLSGFLITYLLLKEHDVKNTISIKKFYVRRILRIWPLYFLLVILGTVVIPVVIDIINNPYEMPYEFKDVILYYIFFSPFLVNVFYGHNLLEPLWSIGVEEVFYIFWAPMFKFFKKHILFILVSIIIVRVVLMYLVFVKYIDGDLAEIIKVLQFESMAIGGLGAYYVFNFKKNISDTILFSKVTQILLLLLILTRIFAYKFLLLHSFFLTDILYYTPIFSPLLLSILFLWLVINIGVNQKSIFSLDFKFLNFLGDISYGIYMYHMIIIFTVVLFLGKKMENYSSLMSTLLFYGIVVMLTIFISFLSKKYFEDKFLKLKKKFH